MATTSVGERVQEAHAQLLAAAALLAHGEVGVDELESSVASIRQVERDCAGLLVAVARLADQAGRSAEVVLADQDSVTPARVGADVARAEMADRFPELGEAIRSGSARPDNVDVLARMCERMTDAEVDVLIQSDAVTADAAARLRTDSFRRKVHRLRDRIRADHGQTAAEQASKDTMASVWPSRDNQTYRMAAVFDVLQGAAAHQALRHQCRVLAEQLGPDHGNSPAQSASEFLGVARWRSQLPALFTRPVVHLDVLTDGATLTLTSA